MYLGFIVPLAAALAAAPLAAQGVSGEDSAKQATTDAASQQGSSETTGPSSGLPADVTNSIQDGHDHVLALGLN